MKIPFLITGLLAGSLITGGIFSKHAEKEKTATTEKIRSLEAALAHAKDKHYESLPQSIAHDPSFIMVSANGIDKRESKLPIPVREYFRYKQMSHATRNTGDYINWVTHHDVHVKDKAEFLTKAFKTPEEKAQQLLHFVHSHIYDRRIEENADYVKYPLETMVERNGDCEDLAILGAALMKSIDLDVVLLFFPPQASGKLCHLGLGIAGNFSGSYYEVKGKRYFYAEPTGTQWMNTPSSWKIGELPNELSGKKAHIYIIK